MNAPITQLMASKSLCVTLRGTELEVMQSAPRFLRIVGLLGDWSLDAVSDRAFLHCSSGLSLYVGFRLTEKEALAIREKFQPLGLHVDSPPTASPSSGAVHEATSAADLPSDGGCGTAPPVQGNAGGSLDSQEVLA